jgi:hypothetical protein
MAITDGPVHIFTDKEIRELKDKERKAVWAEIEEATNKWSDD